MVITLKPDHKGILGAAVDSNPAEITWEMSGDDKIIIHFTLHMTMFRTADGNLRDEEGSTWKKTK